MQSTQTRTTVAGLIDTRGGTGGAAGNVDIKALNSTQRMNLVGNIILPSMSIGGEKSLKQAPDREKTQGRLAYGKDLAKGFSRPRWTASTTAANPRTARPSACRSMSTWRPRHQAVVADTARIYSKDLNVEAGNELVSVTLGASGGQAKTVAVNGVVLVNVTSATTVAQVARGATVAATGTASIQARDATWVGTVAGAAAGSQTVGVGMSVAINDVNRDTQALIGQWRDDATPVTAPPVRSRRASCSSAARTRALSAIWPSPARGYPARWRARATGPARAARAARPAAAPMLGTKAPASQGGATPGKDSAAPDPDELLSLSDILKELSNSTSTLTQDSGSGSGSGGGGSQQQSKAGVAISGAVAVNMVNDFAQAYINAAGLTITIGGDATISATNGTHALALSGAVALAQPDNAKTNVGIAGAYSMNGLGGEARAEVALVGSLLVAGDRPCRPAARAWR